MEQWPRSVPALALFCALAVLGMTAFPLAVESAPPAVQEEHESILVLAREEVAALEDANLALDTASEYALALAAAGITEEASAVLLNAVKQAQAIGAARLSATRLADLAAAAAEIGLEDLANSAAESGESLLTAVEGESKQSDLLGKFLSARAAAGATSDAVARALAMPEHSEALASIKARTLREIAAHQAEAGAFAEAEQTLQRISMGMTYYAAVAHADVAGAALRADQAELARRLLGTAELLARKQENGYFVAGSLRDIALVYLRLGDKERGIGMIADARVGARSANSFQEQARALSRIGTSLADEGLYEEAVELLPEAAALAAQEEQAMMQHYAYYEIAGSAAFAGDFALASSLLVNLPDEAFLSANSLRSVAKRDLAWGLARHGRWEKALEVAAAIPTQREKIQALSRLVRLSADPAMDELPRYL